MKSSKLFLKTLATLVVLFVASDAAVMVTSAWWIDQSLTEQYVSKATAIANSIAGSSVEVLLYRDASTVQAMIDQYQDIQGVAYVFVEDGKGDIISHTFAPSIPDGVRHLPCDRHKTSTQMVVGEGIGECIDVAAPLLAGEVGYVHVGMDRQLIHAAIRTAILRQLTVMSAVLLVGLMAAYFLMKEITRPLNQLAGCARELAVNDSAIAAKAIETLAPIAVRNDEVGHLAKAFQHMVQEVSHREQRLRQTEESLRVSEIHFRSLIENVTDIILKLNAEGTVGYVSPSAQKVLGLDAERFVGRNLLELVHNEDREVLHELLFRACRQANDVAAGEFRLRHDNGSYRLVDASFNNRLADPSVQSLIVTLRDITEHRRTEERWRMANENQRLVAAIPSILIGLDAENRITKWNQAAERTLGASSSEAIGKRLGDLAVEWDGSRLTQYIHDCLFARSSASLGDFTFKRPNGQAGFLSISLTPITGEDGSIQGILLLGTDVTENRNLETQLAHAQKLESIGQLAAGIAHEINTPIQYVGDNVNFLRGAFTDFQGVLDKHGQMLVRAKDKSLDDELIAEVEQAVKNADLAYLADEIPRAIEQTLEGVDRVAKIVRAMKEFAHPGNEGMVASDVNKLVENTVTIANNEWKYVAELVTDFDSSLPLIPCVTGEFNQVVLNLIVNAAHAIGDRNNGNPQQKGLITISTRSLEDEVEIRVQDTGTGIPEAAQAKVFDPFFTTKPVGKGSGQGLAIAHAVIVKKHGGTLTFETELGKGTTFIIRLPKNPGVVISSNKEKHLDTVFAGEVMHSVPT